MCSARSDARPLSCPHRRAITIRGGVMPEEREEGGDHGVSGAELGAGIPVGIVIRGNGGGLPRARVRAYLWARDPEPPVAAARPKLGAGPSA